MTKSAITTIKDEAELKWLDFINQARDLENFHPSLEEMEDEFNLVFTASDFISKASLRNPEMICDLVKTRDLTRSYIKGEYRVKVEKITSFTTGDQIPGKSLRRLRLREMVRIAFRDITGMAALEETMADLSALADSIINGSFSFLFRQMAEKYGTPADKKGGPQQIVVLGLGKLGANELNFSSDVDLMFTYPELGRTTGKASIENKEFFTILARSFLKLFSPSPEGNLFRVDLRLRPYGENGPLVMSFNEIEYYYESQGREWERYALVKARPVAGDLESGGQIIQRLKPFVYRRYLDYGSFDALRNMKKSIVLEVKNKGLKDNIKLGAGGIREIEFFGQVFQLIRGGVEPALQEPSILKILFLLKANNYIDENIYSELKKAYFFLRNTEHRLQEFDDRQTHALPRDQTGRLRLAMACGYGLEPDLFFKNLESLMSSVHSRFIELLESGNTNNEADPADTAMEEVWFEIADEKCAAKILEETGYESPYEVLKLLADLKEAVPTRSLSIEGRKRLNMLIPILMRKLPQASSKPIDSLKRIIGLLKTIEQRTCYIALLLENLDALALLINLADKSPWIIAFLSRHPVLLDELLDARTLFMPPPRDEMKNEISRRMYSSEEDDLEQEIEKLCIFKNINILRVAAADISASYPLMRVSDQLSWLAELIIGKVFESSWRYLTKRHGNPVAVLENEKCVNGFAIVAYGKLGGIELGYGSDLDLVFLHASGPGQTTGKNPTGNAQFFTRLGQRVIHLLTAHTRAGSLYEIDMRLRPNGSSGPLVSHVDSFEAYQTDSAWTWEHQALVRARFICGDTKIERKFNQIRRKILSVPRDKSKLIEEITVMRDKMRINSLVNNPGMFDLKQGRGGIVDLEFLVQFIVLCHAHDNPELMKWTDNVRILEAIAQTGIMDKNLALSLKEAYLHFRSTVHRLNLQERPHVVPDKEDKIAAIRDIVAKTWESFLGNTKRP